MPRPYVPRLSAAVWLEAQRYWEQHPRTNADEIARRFGTSRAAVKHRITRERWTRGFAYQLTPTDDLCPVCAAAAQGRTITVRLMAPFAQKPTPNIGVRP